MQRVINNGIFGGIPEEMIRNIALGSGYFGMRALACVNKYFHRVMEEGGEELMKRFVKNGDKLKKYHACLGTVRRMEASLDWIFYSKVWVVLYLNGKGGYFSNFEYYFGNMERYARKDRRELEKVRVDGVEGFDGQKFLKEKSEVKKYLEDEKKVRGRRVMKWNKAALKSWEGSLKGIEKLYWKIMKREGCEFALLAFIIVALCNGLLNSWKWVFVSGLFVVLSILR